MARHKCIPSTTKLTCTAAPPGSACELMIKDLKVKLKTQPLGIETDMDFLGFGTCTLTGRACSPDVKAWDYLSDSKKRSNGKRLLTGHSILACKTGPGLISIKVAPPKPPTPDENTFFGSLENGLNNAESMLKAPASSLAKAAGNSWLGKKAIGLFKGASEMAGEAQKAVLKKTAEWGVENGTQFAFDVVNNLAHQATHYGTRAMNFVIESVDEGASNTYDNVQEVVAYGERLETSDNRLETLLEIAEEERQQAIQNASAAIEHFDKEIDKFKEAPIDYMLQGYWEVRSGLTDGIERLNDQSLSQEERTTGMIDASASAVMYSIEKGTMIAGGITSARSGILKAKSVLKKKGDGNLNVDSKPNEQTQNGNADTDGSNSKDSDGTNNQEQGEGQEGQSDSQSEGRTNNESNDSTNGEQDAGDPIDVVTGTVINDYLDFEIPGIIPIQWKRVWYSDAAYQGPLGYGCHHSYDIHLIIRQNDSMVTLADGRPAFFPLLGSEELISAYNKKEKLSLTLRKDRRYELFDHKTQFTYVLENRNRKYLTTRLSNHSGIYIDFQYINDRLHRIIDTAGRLIKIDSDNNDRITKITLHHKLQEKTLVSYDYNEVGDMIMMTDSLGQSTRAVFKNHLMISKTDRNGQTYYWEYDGFKTGAKCIHTWGDGGVLEYHVQYGKGYNIVTNSLGHTSLFYHQGGNLATKIVDPLGGEKIKEFDENKQLIKTIDEEGAVTSFMQDEKGNRIAIKFPDGASTNFAYDDKGRLQLLTRPEGGNIIRSYKNDRLDCIISADGMMTTFAYNDKGLISAVFDNQDNETLLYYDEDHNLIKMILPNGAISTWEYDVWGQCIAAINPENHKQQFHYDILGRVTNVQLPDNNEVTLKYNGYEQVIEAVDKHRTVKFEYTPVGSLKTREENGTKINFGYDTEDQLVGVINRKGESYRFTRDAKGNIIKEQGYDDITRRFSRDKAGKVFKVNRPDDKYSIYEYDKGSRISRVEHHDSTWATYNYNKDGLLVEAVNPNSHVKFTRDEGGRIISENQDGYTVTSKYGELGVRTDIKSSLGAAINFEHSGIGQGTKTIAKTGKSKVWEASYKYNSLGMETERVLSGGVTSTWSYDSAGLPLQQKTNNQRGEQRNRSYNWDVNNKLQKITDNLTNGIVNFSYDDFNNLATAQYEDGSYDYKLPDEVGNLYRTKGKNDKEYGKSGRLLKSGTTNYHYDDEGNLIKKDTVEGIWKYAWEADGMLQSVVKPDKIKIDFEYDALGRRTTKIVQPSLLIQNNSLREKSRGDLITRWVWDGNVPLHEWQYHLKDRPKTIVDKTDTITKDTKEPVETLITWVFDQGTFKPAAKITAEDAYSIITDHLGTPVEMYNSIGEKTWKVEYDIYGKVRKLIKGSLNDCRYRYQGQYEDEETGLYYNRFRYYSPDDGVYISQDPIRLAGNNPNIYAYTRDNNSFIDVFGLDEAKKDAEFAREGDVDGNIAVPYNSDKGRNKTKDAESGNWVDARTGEIVDPPVYPTELLKDDGTIDHNDIKQWAKENNLENQWDDSSPRDRYTLDDLGERGFSYKSEDGIIKIHGHGPDSKAPGGKSPTTPTTTITINDHAKKDGNILVGTNEKPNYNTKATNINEEGKTVVRPTTDEKDSVHIETTNSPYVNPPPASDDD